MTYDDLLALLRSLPGTVVTAENGPVPADGAQDNLFGIYDPAGDLPPNRQQPFTTVMVRDYPGWDEASRLDRPDAFRVNVAAGRDRYTELLGHQPSELDTHRDGYDFTAYDVLLPNPSYGGQGWVSVLCPGAGTADLVRALVTDAHAAAVARHDRRGG